MLLRFLQCEPNACRTKCTFHNLFLQLHRIIRFCSNFFHGCPQTPFSVNFYSIVCHTSKLQFFHCFSIVSRFAVLYAIMAQIPHRSLNFTWCYIKTAIFPLLFQCFTRALRDLASFYPLLIVSTVVINFPSVLLKFAIAFPFFSHCFTINNILHLFIVYPKFQTYGTRRLHCLQNLGKN